jgi:hypothetical protein
MRSIKNSELEMSDMRQRNLSENLKYEGLSGSNLLTSNPLAPRLAKLAVLAMVVAMCFPAISKAQQPGQKTFKSAEGAANALFTAAKNNDEKVMLEILGPDGKRVVSSGDEAEDAEHRADFAQRYQQMHRLVTEPDGSTVLYIGAENWPTPIPLMHKGTAWYFDTEAGKKEILYRLVGRNELSAIKVCQELVMAQKEYSTQHSGEYAQKIFSDVGQHNGLYWKSADGEPQSPVGPLVADAVAEGYAKSQVGAPTPYRGYYFHILTGEGKKSFLQNGKMAGFAFVAYPAEYRSSGVMTFVVGEDGVVYEKDLGKKTEVIAKNMKSYTMSAGWHKAEEGQEDAANQMPK